MQSAIPPVRSKQRILLVDDDEDDYVLTRRMLVDCGRDQFTLDWVSTYEEGLDRVLAGEYAAVLVDYDLGVDKGTDLIEQALAGGCQTPMIVYTGRGNYDVDVQAMRSGAADYINKTEASPALLERSIRYAIERKHTENALHTALAQAEEGRRTLEAVMHNVPVGIILTGPPPDFPIEKVSRYVVELTGRPLHRLTGLPVGKHLDNWRLFLADGKTRPSEADLPIYRAAHWGEATQNQEMFLLGARGRRIPILVSAAPLRDRHGQIVAAIGVFHDITDRKQAEQAVAESEAVLRGLFESDSVLAGVVELDGDDLIYVISNPKLADFFGQTPATLAGRRASEIGLDAETLADWLHTYRLCLQSGAPIEREYSLSYQGKTGWYLGTFSQIRSGSSGRPRFAVLIVDISDRKQAEQSLHLSEERFRLASRATTAVIYDWDLLTEEIYESEAMLNVVGYRPEETPQHGEQRWWPANIHPEDSGRVQRDLQAALKGLSDSVAYEYRIRHADGHWVEVWDQAYIVRDEHGEAIRMVGTCTDISERKRWEARTRQQNAVLDAINRIFQEALTSGSEEELGKTCLTIAEELTQSPLGFIGEVDANNRLRDLAINGAGWTACNQHSAQNQDPVPEAIEIDGLLARVLQAGQSLLTNNPREDRDAAGLPADHTPLAAFLGVPLVQAGQTTGLLAVGNREGGYREIDRECLEALAPAVVEAFARKRTEQALRESEERFRIALANTPMVIFTMDRALRYTWIYNPRKEFTIEGTIGKRDEDLLDPDSARMLTEIKQQVLESGLGVHREVTYRINGAPVVYDMTIEPLRDEAGQVSGIIAATMDITRARQIESEMRSAADRLEIQRQILQHREQERMQIARDLHDGLLQELIGLTYMLREGLDITEKAARIAKFAEIMAVLQAQIQEVRAFCSYLRPPSLVPFGLERSIKNFAATHEEKYPELAIELNLMKDRRLLPETLRMALFRIVQESVNNARKHAQAQKVQIHFTFDDREIFLEVQDDGIGFEVPENWLALSRRGHLGLVGIHERAEAVGGRLQVISSPGKGTRVQVTVPRDPLQLQEDAE